VFRHIRLICALCACFASPVAFAHGNMNAGAFYQGMASVFLHWDLLLFLIAAALWAGQHPPGVQPVLGAVLVFGIGTGFLTALGGIHAPLPVVASAGPFALLGLLVAAQLARPAWLSLALAAAASLCTGVALGTLELAAIERPFLFIGGLMLAAGMTVFYIVAAVVRLPAGWPWIGVRVIGSWIAAIGLIVCAYGWRAI
jgi:hydrogenase/urease accessory protein HupE